MATTQSFDVFGRKPAAVERALELGAFWYDRYFRVASEGSENIPLDGPAIIVANHSGVLPIDAALLWLDIGRRTPRRLRPIADRFVPLLPFIGTWFARTGVVSGTHANVRRLLRERELIAIFPEGVAGPAKPFSRRYELQQWRVGHAELAIRYRAPIIPAAIIGAEEAWPVLLRLRGLRAFGAPYLPVPMVPLPLPVSIHIHYGEPIELFRDYPVETADDPGAVGEAAEDVKDAVAALVARGLGARRIS
jgi:1-acyl-sn-glycerol-3-phosphate acyltransferase